METDLKYFNLIDMWVNAFNVTVHKVYTAQRTKIYLKGNGYTSKGNNSNKEIFASLLIRGYS